MFSWPTRLISEVQEFLAITAAIKTNPWLFVAFEAVICAPSGDQLHMVRYVNSSEGTTHLRRRKKVPGEASKGFSTSASKLQSEVLHIFTDLSSEAVARNSPTGSQHTPLTNPLCKSSTRRRSTKAESSARVLFRGLAPTKGKSTPNKNLRVEAHGSKVPIPGCPGEVCDILVHCERHGQFTNRREFLPLS